MSPRLRNAYVMAVSLSCIVGCSAPRVCVETSDCVRGLVCVDHQCEYPSDSGLVDAGPADAAVAVFEDAGSTAPRDVMSRDTT